ncbi:MAG: hypothetical protein OHK93_000582 [Ramalina farinacea]|uniref:F-box domain-containing protein n=1 Tax=Ramalina farinacea TaxID=258253 RepID=A0AA43TRY0_9LECA|nr:hypothetical protein [Ramalina farinacea]
MESYVRTPLHDLTPVRIRGKRYAPGQKPTIHTQHNNAYTPSSYTTDQSNRPHLSRLEILPTELLHHIFRFCPNIYLPVASPTLGQILSDKAIKFHIVIQTLSNRQTLIDAVAEASGHTSIASLQSEVLNRKWLTFEFLRDALKEAAKLPRPDAFLDYANDGEPDEDSSLSAVDTEFDLISVTGADSPIARKPKKAKKSPLYQNLDLNQYTAVPVKLLHGPWTASKLSLLKLLFRAGGSIERVTSTDDEVASASLLEALKSSNRKVALALIPRPSYRSFNDLDNYTEPPHIGVTPDTSHFRAAVLEGGCDRKIVLKMLLLLPHVIDYEDRAVWKWIHDSISVGDEKGLWLKQTLGEASKAAKDPAAKMYLIAEHFEGGVSWQ